MQAVHTSDFCTCTAHEIKGMNAIFYPVNCLDCNCIGTQDLNFLRYVFLFSDAIILDLRTLTFFEIYNFCSFFKLVSLLKFESPGFPAEEIGAMIPKNLVFLPFMACQPQSGIYAINICTSIYIRMYKYVKYEWTQCLY